MFRRIMLIAAIATSSMAIGAPPAQFLHKALEGDNSEANLGQLIASRGFSREVRDYGNTLTSDHRQARTQAADLARRMHVPVPNSMMPEARAEYSKLQHLRGRAFDREVRRYMIEDHRKDIADFQKQVRSGEPRTASLAQAQLPTLKKHLQLAQSLPQ